jgi:hypothetical protein
LEKKMARLEDKISPTGLLLAIKSGRLKNEIIKEYRTSEEELAMMLLPMYRSGELSKQEFNRFFRGVPVFEETQEAPLEQDDVEKKAKAPAPPAQPRPKAQTKAKPVAEHTDPPSEIFRVFSNVFSRKSGQEEPEGVPNPNNEPEEIAHDDIDNNETPHIEQYDDESSIGGLDPISLDDLSENQSLRIDQEELERLEQEETERVGFSLEAQPAPYEIEMDDERSDGPGEKSSNEALNRINETLANIQKRLDHIERKLGINS